MNFLYVRGNPLIQQHFSAKNKGMSKMSEKKVKEKEEVIANVKTEDTKM